MMLLLSISVWDSALFPLWLSALLRVSFSPLLFPALRVSASSSSSLPYPGVQTGYLGAESLLTMDAVSSGQGWAGEWQPTPLPLTHHHAGPTCSQWCGSRNLTLSRCLAPCGILITSYSLMPFPKKNTDQTPPSSTSFCPITVSESLGSQLRNSRPVINHAYCLITAAVMY